MDVFGMLRFLRGERGRDDGPVRPAPTDDEDIAAELAKRREWEREWRRRARSGRGEPPLPSMRARHRPPSRWRFRP